MTEYPEICAYHCRAKRLTTSHHAVVIGTVSAMSLSRTIGKITPSQTCFLLCDVQDRFRSVIHNAESVVKTSNFLCRVGNKLGIPIVGTEQYPKAFGRTCEDVLLLPSEDGSAPGRIEPAIYEKKLFSMITPEVSSHLATLDRSCFVLFGIEAHVCVQQTCLDLLDQGHDVHIVADAVSSQSPFDRSIALERMRQSGAYITTAQSLVFMLLGSAEHPDFKTLSKMVVAHSKEGNEFHQN